jgi:hypothetical protein
VETSEMSEAAIKGSVSKENLDNSEIVTTEQMGTGSQFYQSPRTSMEITLILNILFPVLCFNTFLAYVPNGSARPH